MQRVVEPAVGEHRRVDAVRERTQLVERLVHLVLELAQALDAALGIPPDDLLRQLELDPQRDEPLLGAVVQVALDPAPLVLGAGRDAGARELELAHRRLGLGGQPLVLEHHGGHRGARLEQLGPLEQPFVVDDRGHHRAVTADLADRASAVRAGQLGRAAPRVHPAVGGAARGRGS